MKKNYITRGDQKYVDAVFDDIALMRTQAYQAAFDEYHTASLEQIVAETGMVAAARAGEAGT